MKPMRIYLKVFSFAFIFNFVWENLHAPLYLHYRGGSITELILLRAALVDAALILFFSFLAAPLKQKKSRYRLLLFLGLVTAIILEKWALATDRWQYSSAMPIIPILKTGLTPTIQLGLLGPMSRYLANRNQ